MGLENGVHDSTTEDFTKSHYHLVYARKMHERKIFMEELKDIRKDRNKRVLKFIKNSIGPIWYQVLSVAQRKALDNLEKSIYQDLLEGRPTRTIKIIHILGLFPAPCYSDLMNSLIIARDDPKKLFAELFALKYEHYFYEKRDSYNLNAKLLLSAIFYLGLRDLIHLLKDKFGPGLVEMPPKPKPVPAVEPPLKSPYLQRMVAGLYLPRARKVYTPAPLPNLDDLNEPYEPLPPARKPSPPQPPPPPLKKRLPRSYCDKIAGYSKIEPYSSALKPAVKAVAPTNTKKIRLSDISMDSIQKSLMRSALPKKPVKRRKLVAPNTGLENAQYAINGVFSIHGKPVYVLDNVSILPAEGILIHGGYRLYKGEYINIICGFRALPLSKKQGTCDCFKKWHDTVFEYVKSTKCICHHHYDYGHEESATFPSDELPYFEKPTARTPFRFNYDTIFELDQKRIHIEKEFKKQWDNDSVLNEDVDDATLSKKDKKKKPKEKEKKGTASNTCLGRNPQPEDYLKCALRTMWNVNIAAQLPDAHLAPELREWMRRRIYGPYTRADRNKLLHQSTDFWTFLKSLEAHGMGHISPPKDPVYLARSTWAHKLELSHRFKVFIQNYKLTIYRMHARLNNLLWATMCQVQFPDKKFREIFFSYLFSRLGDFQIMHPYSQKESADRMLVMAKSRYCCPPGGYEPKS